MSAPTLASGVVTDLDEQEYHRHPALSQSGARKLLACPAKFKWERDHPTPPTASMEFGSAAHQMVLGIGPDVVPVDADSWRTKDAKAQAADIRAAGGVPLLRDKYDECRAMADALAGHELAMALLRDGQPEVSLFATDTESGVDLRGRLDWLPNPRGGRLIATDYKTSKSANPQAFARSAADYGYHMQAAFYLDLLRAVALADDDAAFVFIVQEVAAPYLVTVVELDDLYQRIGRDLNRKAITIYAECCATDTWPGYATDVELVSPPGWLRHAYENGEI